MRLRRLLPILLLLALAGTIWKKGVSPHLPPKPGPGLALGISVPAERVLAPTWTSVRSGPWRVVRITLPWAQVEPEKGTYRWDPWARAVKQLHQEGYIPLLVLDTTPSWARAPEDADNPFAPPQNPADMAEFAREVARQLGPWVQYYQVWDEPNIAPHWGHREADPLGYVQLLQRVALALRDTDPDARILPAGLAPTLDPGRVNRNDLAYLDAFLRLGGGEWIDVLAWEPYGFHRPPEDPPAEEVLNFRRAELARAILVHHGLQDLPMWSVAFGWHAIPHSPWDGVSRDRQAYYAQRAVTWAEEHWPWMDVLIWTHAWPAAPPSDPLWGFALWEPDGTPRAVARTLATFPPRTPPTPQAHPSPLWLPMAQGDAWEMEFSGDLNLEVGVGPRWFTFWAWVDGRPAQGLPRDERGWAYVNTYAAREGREIRVRVRGRPGERHVLRLVAGPGDPIWPVWRRVPEADPRSMWGAWLAGVGTFLGVWLFLRGGWAGWLRTARDGPPWAVRGWQWGLVLSGGMVPFTSQLVQVGDRSLVLPEVGLEGALLLAGLAVLGQSARGRRWKSHPVAWEKALSLSLVAGVLVAHGVLHRDDPAVWVALRSRVLFPLLLFALLWGSDKDTRIRFLRMLLWGGTAVALWALLQGPEDVGAGIARLHGFFGSPNHLALVLIRLLPFALLWPAIHGGRLSRWEGWGIGGILLLTLALTGSRGAWFIALPVMALTLKPRGRAGQVWVGTGLLAGLLLLWHRDGGTWTARVRIWKGLWRLLEDHGWWGIGLGRFAQVYPRYALPDAWREPLLYHGHNVALTTLTWVGMPAAVAVFYWLGQELRARPSSPLGRAAWSSLLAGLAFGMVDAFWALPDLAYLTAIGLLFISEERVD
ncbi:MAG: hypothetical protein GXO55_08315 [Chloroflexi bacterium]|nr:hypothetical protein [Chloroflexota bacterium]